VKPAGDCEGGDAFYEGVKERYVTILKLQLENLHDFPF